MAEQAQWDSTIDTATPAETATRRPVPRPAERRYTSTATTSGTANARPIAAAMTSRDVGPMSRLLLVCYAP